MPVAMGYTAPHYSAFFPSPSRRFRLISVHLLSFFVIVLHLLFHDPYPALLLPTLWRNGGARPFQQFSPLFVHSTFFLWIRRVRNNSTKMPAKRVTGTARVKQLYDLRQCNFDCAQTLSQYISARYLCPFAHVRSINPNKRVYI